MLIHTWDIRDDREESTASTQIIGMSTSNFLDTFSHTFFAQSKHKYNNNQISKSFNIELFINILIILPCKFLPRQTFKSLSGYET